MSEQTHILDSVALNTASSKPTKPTATVIGGAIATGLGAVAIDAYAEESSTVEETPNHTPSTSTDTSAVVEESVSTPSDSTTTTPPSSSPPVSTPVTLIPDHITVANAPDHLSFGEAFQLARQDFGAGALFEWRGNLYHTYHADEYAALSSDVKQLHQALWIAEYSPLNPNGIVPDAEGQFVVMNISQAPTDELPTDMSSPDSSYVPSSAPEEYAYNTEEIAEDEYDNDYDGIEDFMNPEDLA